MSFLRKIVFRLLYLTPIGYVLDASLLLQNQKIKGIQVEMGSDTPFSAFVKENPSRGARLNWFINGIVLIAEAWFAVVNDIAGDIGGTFAIIAFLFGFISVVSAVFPKVSWNKKLF